MAVSVRVDVTSKYDKGLTSDGSFSIVIGSGSAQVYLTRDEALFVVSELGKRLMQLTTEPKEYEELKLDKVIDEAMAEAAPAPVSRGYDPGF